MDTVHKFKTGLEERNLDLHWKKFSMRRIPKNSSIGQSGQTRFSPVFDTALLVFMPFTDRAVTRAAKCCRRKLKMFVLRKALLKGAEDLTPVLGEREIMKQIDSLCRGGCMLLFQLTYLNCSPGMLAPEDSSEWHWGQQRALRFKIVLWNGKL